jgi:hypothetical protein
MAEKRAKKWVWCISALAAAGVVISVLAAMHPSRYAFLERYHPRHVKVDMNRIFSSSGPSRSLVPTLPPVTMYVFDYKDSNAVLADLKRELTKGRGYQVKDESDSSTDVQYQFLTGKPSGSLGMPPAESAIFQSGKEAARDEAMYEQGISVHGFLRRQRPQN